MNQEDHGVSIHAGFPNPATDSTIQNLNLNQLLVWHSASTFMMKITGKEWEGQGIFENDIAIIDRALSPKILDKVAWIKDDQFMISDRSAMPKSALFWGVVTAVIHRYRRLQ